METIIDQCATCRKVGPIKNANRCENCWEVERRLKEYLKSEKGYRLVHGELCKVRYGPWENPK
jgi:hypothetical protein